MVYSTDSPYLLNPGFLNVPASEQDPQQPWILPMSAIRKRRSASRDSETSRPMIAELPMTSFLRRAIKASRKEEAEAKRPPKALRASPMTSNVDYTDAEREYLVKVDEYKRKMGRPFLTNTEIFALMTRELGYTKN